LIVGTRLNLDSQFFEILLIGYFAEIPSYKPVNIINSICDVSYLLILSRLTYKFFVFTIRNIRWSWSLSLCIHKYLWFTIVPMGNSNWTSANVDSNNWLFVWNITDIHERCYY